MMKDESQGIVVEADKNVAGQLQRVRLVANQRPAMPLRALHKRISKRHRLTSEGA
jgi:hypothetical protein